MMRRAGAAPSRHPAARHHREHLARHHLDLHLRPGAVLGACGCLGRRARDAGFGAVSLRLRRALCRPFQRAGRGRSGGEIEGRPGAGLGDLEPHAVVDRAGSGRRAKDHRAAAVPRTRRSSGGTAGVRDLAGRRRRHGDGSPDVERARLRLERRYCPRRWRRSPKSSPCPIPPSTARRCWCRMPAPASRRSRKP